MTNANRIRWDALLKQGNTTNKKWDREQLRAWVEDGWSNTEIAEHMDSMPPTVSALLGYHGIRRTAAQRAAIREREDVPFLSYSPHECVVLADQGLSNQQIAERLDITYSAVTNSLHKLGYRRPPGHRGTGSILESPKGPALIARIAQGKSARQVALEVHVAASTVRRIRAKLQAPR